MVSNNQTRLSLTKRLLISLFFYYTLLLLVSLVGLILFFRLIDPNNDGSSAPIWLCIVGSFLSAILGNVIYYIRKLYKMCIRGELDISTSCREREIGTSIYFFSRPLFSCAFAFLLVMSLRAENQFVSPSGTIDNKNFIYVCMFVSFLSGFSAGKVLSVLEKKGSPINGGE